MSWIELGAGIKCIDVEAAAKILAADIEIARRKSEAEQADLEDAAVREYAEAVQR